MFYYGCVNKDLVVVLYLKKISFFSFSKILCGLRIFFVIFNIIMCYFISSFVLDVYWFVKIRVYFIIYFIWRIKCLYGKLM